MGTTEGCNALHSKPRRKRAPHSKVKTGCITCKYVYKGFKGTLHEGTYVRYTAGTDCSLEFAGFVVMSRSRSAIVASRLDASVTATRQMLLLQTHKEGISHLAWGAIAPPVSLIDLSVLTIGGSTLLWHFPA